MGTPPGDRRKAAYLPRAPVIPTTEGGKGPAAIHIVLALLGAGLLLLAAVVGAAILARGEGAASPGPWLGVALVAGLFLRWVWGTHRRSSSARRKVEERYRSEGRVRAARIVHKAAEERGGYDDAPDLVLYLQFDPGFIVRAELGGRVRRLYDREVGAEVSIEHLESNPKVCRIAR